MTNENNKITIEGVEYTKEELDKIYEELLKPTPTPTDSSKDRKFGKAFFLTDDDFGREIHNAVMTRYSGVNAITKINLGQGSNPFYAVAVNEVLREKFPKITTATQADLEKILRENSLELKEHYEDSGLVLRNRQDPNGYLAGNLFEQFKTQGKNLKENSAYVLWLHNLSLKKDSNSSYKVSFVIPTNFADYFEAPILNEFSQRYFESSDIDVSTGITKKVSATGTRKLYTRNWNEYPVKNSGFVRLFLGRGLDLGSYDDGLADSGDYGRVVLISAEGGTP